MNDDTQPSTSTGDMPPPPENLTLEAQQSLAQQGVAQLPQEIQLALMTGAGAAGVRKQIEFYGEMLNGGPEGTPFPGDPRVQLAMAVLRDVRPENLIPSVKVAAAEVLKAAMLIRPVEQGACYPGASGE